MPTIHSSACSTIYSMRLSLFCFGKKLKYRLFLFFIFKPTLFSAVRLSPFWFWEKTEMYTIFIFYFLFLEPLSLVQLDDKWPFLDNCFLLCMQHSHCSQYAHLADNVDNLMYCCVCITH